MTKILKVFFRKINLHNQLHARLICDQLSKTFLNFCCFVFFSILASCWCMKDAKLEVVTLVQQRVSQLSTDLEKMSFESEKQKNNFEKMLKNAQRCLQEEEKRARKLPSV